MKKILTSFMAGVIVTILMINSVAYATGNKDLIEVILNSINVAINGEKVVGTGQAYQLNNGENVPYSISYKDTTYLPIRKVSEILGKEVSWDGTTKTAHIDDKTVTETVKNETNINQQEDNKGKEQGNKEYQIHAYYAIKSYPQYKNMMADSSLLDY